MKMQLFRNPVLFVATALFAFACLEGGASDGAGPETDGDAEVQAEADAADATEAGGSFPYQAFYDELQQKIWDFPFESGKWHDDFGDAAFYGIAFYTRAGAELKRADYEDRASLARNRNIDLLKQAQEDYLMFLDKLDEVLLAALGLIEDENETGDGAARTDVDAVLDMTNELVKSLGVYLEVDMESYALQTYGATTITGVVALANLRYAELLKGPRVQERIEFGREVIRTIDEKAFNGTFYRFNTKTENLDLYPNVMMILAAGTAFRLTGEQTYKDRCLALFEAIQPLKDKKKCYHSPYSAAYMGAETDDYSTLSSQNYTILAFAMLFEITGDDKYKTEILNIIGFIHDYLYVDGRLLHHWMDGCIAKPTDPEYFCSGCNLQFLYAVWYVKKHVFP